MPDPECRSHKIVFIYLDSNGAAKELRKFFNNEFEHCLNCGGLIPELKIRFKERTYVLTLTEVNEFVVTHVDDMGDLGKIPVSEEKVILETDYPKFLKYLQVRYGEK